MLLSIFQTLAGMTLLLVGGDLMVRGASSLARSLGVAPLVVGLTIVAFGTSAPELAVSVGAAITGASTLAFGNIFGSNLANIGLIIGMSAIIRPLPIEGLVVRRELPMMLLSAIAALAMASDELFSEGPAQYSRIDGVVMLLFFSVFVYYTLAELFYQQDEATRELEAQPAATDLEVVANANADDPDPCVEIVQKHPTRDLTFVVAGIVGLLFGADLTVDGGVSIARALGVSEVVVGLTMISIGTSLPEFVATLSAVRHGEVAIAVGGVVGSNIFNTLMICGVTATIHPIAVPQRGLFDLTFTALLTIALILTAHSHRQSIQRHEGAALMLGYLCYMTWRTF